MLTLAAWLHTLDPFLWRISGDFGIRWYGLSYLAGFLIAFVILRALARRELIAIPADRVDAAMLWLVGGTLIGGRVGYLALYQPTLFVTWLDHAPWWGALAINEGGMASHGGMVGLMVACLRISRGWKYEDGHVEGRCSVLHVMDAAGLVAPFGVFFGRLANFVNGELLGAVVSKPGVAGTWWSVQFPQELESIVKDPSRVPALSDPIASDRLMRMIDSAAPGKPIEVGMRRVVAHPENYASDLVQVLSSRHPSQLYQAAAEGLVVGCVLWLLWFKVGRDRARAGVIAGAFFVTYGVLRILTETVRLPDAQFAEGRPWGLSRGQWYSVPMVIGGLVLIGYAVSRARRARLNRA